MDPLAEEMTSWSPYNYVFGNPIKLIDLDRRAPECLTCIGGAILGAAVDYGTQVASNAIRNGGLSRKAFTEDISVSSIVVSTVEGFFSNGASAAKTLGMKVTSAVVNNTIDVKVTGEGVDVDLDHNPSNILKNAAIDFASDGLVENVVPSQKTMKAFASRNEVNSGTVAKNVKKVIRAAGGKVTGDVSKMVKNLSGKAVDGVSSGINTTIQSGSKAVADETKKEFKKATDYKEW